MWGSIIKWTAQAGMAAWGLIAEANSRAEAARREAEKFNPPDITIDEEVLPIVYGRQMVKGRIAYWDGGRAIGIEQSFKRAWGLFGSAEAITGYQYQSTLDMVFVRQGFLPFAAMPEDYGQRNEPGFNRRVEIVSVVVDGKVLFYREGQQGLPWEQNYTNGPDRGPIVTNPQPSLILPGGAPNPNFLLQNAERVVRGEYFVNRPFWSARNPDEVDEPAGNGDFAGVTVGTSIYDENGNLLPEAVRLARRGRHAGLYGYVRVYGGGLNQETRAELVQHGAASGIVGYQPWDTIYKHTDDEGNLIYPNEAAIPGFQPEIEGVAPRDAQGAVSEHNGIVRVVLDKMMLGKEPRLPDIHAEIEYLPGIGTQFKSYSHNEIDANPACVIYDILHRGNLSDKLGEMIPAANLDTVSFEAAATTLMAEQCGVSFSIIKEETRKTIIGRMLDLIDAVLYEEFEESTGSAIIKLRLVREETTTNEVVGENDVIKLHSVQRKSGENIQNTMRVKYTTRGAPDNVTYKESSHAIYNEAEIAKPGANRNPVTANYRELFADNDDMGAVNVATRQLRLITTPDVSVKLDVTNTVGRRLSIGDIVGLTVADTGFPANTFFRLAEKTHHVLEKDIYSLVLVLEKFTGGDSNYAPSLGDFDLADDRLRAAQASYVNAAPAAVAVAAGKSIATGNCYFWGFQSEPISSQYAQSTLGYTLSSGLSGGASLVGERSFDRSNLFRVPYGRLRDFLAKPDIPYAQNVRLRLQDMSSGGALIASQQGILQLVSQSESDVPVKTTEVNDEFLCLITDGVNEEFIRVPKWWQTLDPPQVQNQAAGAPANVIQRGQWDTVPRDWQPGADVFLMVGLRRNVSDTTIQDRWEAGPVDVTSRGFRDDGFGIDIYSSQGTARRLTYPIRNPSAADPASVVRAHRGGASSLRLDARRGRRPLPPHVENINFFGGGLSFSVRYRNPYGTTRRGDFADIADYTVAVAGSYGDVIKYYFNPENVLSSLPGIISAGKTIPYATGADVHHESIPIPTHGEPGELLLWTEQSDIDNSMRQNQIYGADGVRSDILRIRG